MVSCEVSFVAQNLVRHLVHVLILQKDSKAASDH